MYVCFAKRTKRLKWWKTDAVVLKIVAELSAQSHAESYSNMFSILSQFSLSNFLKQSLFSLWIMWLVPKNKQFAAANFKDVKKEDTHIILQNVWTCPAAFLKTTSSFSFCFIDLHFKTLAKVYLLKWLEQTFIVSPLTSFRLAVHRTSGCSMRKTRLSAPSKE